MRLSTQYVKLLVYKTFSQFCIAKSGMAINQSQESIFSYFTMARIIGSLVFDPAHVFKSVTVWNQPYPDHHENASRHYTNNLGMNHRTELSPSHFYQCLNNQIVVTAVFLPLHMQQTYSMENRQ